MAKKDNGPVTNTGNTAPTTLEEALVVIAEKDAAIAELNTVITELRSTPSVGEKPSFTLAGKKYSVGVKSFLHKRVSVTTQELCSNPTLQAELVAKQIGFITEITD